MHPDTRKVVLTSVMIRVDMHNPSLCGEYCYFLQKRKYNGDPDISTRNGLLWPRN